MNKTANKNENHSKNSTNQMKYEIANELGVNLNDKNITSKDAGKVGGEMTRRLVDAGKNK